MNPRRHSTTALSVLITVLSGILAGCSNERRTELAASEMVKRVPVVVAQKRIAPNWLEGVGTVRAAQTSQVASRTMGNIVEIRAREGDRVQRGQVLAVIDETQLRSAVEQAAAAQSAAEKEISIADSDFSLAEVTLKRYQQLYEMKSVSPQEFDEVKARYQSAQARREMARAEQSRAAAVLNQAGTSLGYAQIRAPFAGLVTEKKADAGTLASPGMHLFTLEDTRSYQLEATVDERDIRIVRIRETVPASIDALGVAELPGKVVQIVPAADPASRSLLVKVELPSDPRLRSGLFGRARFPRGERTLLSIPRAAVVERGQLQGVFVIDADQMAGLRYITLGKTIGDQVEVLSGLQDGEKLVAAPGSRDLIGKRIAQQ